MSFIIPFFIVTPSIVFSLGSVLCSLVSVLEDEAVEELDVDETGRKEKDTASSSEESRMTGDIERSVRGNLSFVHFLLEGGERGEPGTGCSERRIDTS